MPASTHRRRAPQNGRSHSDAAPVPASDATVLPATLPACAAVDPLDPDGLGPLPQVPLLPDALRHKHKVFVEADPRFRASARFLQALWREDRGIPIGMHEDQKGRRCTLGSRISSAITPSNGSECGQGPISGFGAAGRRPHWGSSCVPRSGSRDRPVA